MKTTLILVFGTLLVLAMFVANRLMPVCLKMDSDELSAIFTGLGFVGLLATLNHEREQAADSEVDHAEMIDKMRAATREQLLKFKHQRLTAKRAELVKKPYDMHVGPVKVIDDELDRIEKELDRMINYTEPK